jgi:Cu/Ag efflux pump CusA
MLVTAVWPGATMEETQRQLTDRLERRLEETTGLDALRSITRPGIVTIYVDLDGAFPPERVPSVWQEVRNGIGDIRHTLPQGVLGPFFNDDFGDVFGIIYAFTADGFSDRELRDYVDGVRSDLLREVDGIAKIEFIGVQDETGLHRVPARPRRRHGPGLRPDLQRHRRAERGAPLGHDQLGAGEPRAARDSAPSRPRPTCSRSR